MAFVHYDLGNIKFVLYFALMFVLVITFILWSINEEYESDKISKIIKYLKHGNLILIGLILIITCAMYYVEIKYPEYLIEDIQKYKTSWRWNL